MDKIVIALNNMVTVQHTVVVKDVCFLFLFKKSKKFFFESMTEVLIVTVKNYFINYSYSRQQNGYCFK